MNSRSTDWRLLYSHDLPTSKLPTELDVIQYYNFLIVKLMTSNEKFLNKTPSFNDIKGDLISGLCELWKKACLPVVSDERIAFLVDRLYKRFMKEKAAAKRKKIENFSQQFEILFDLCACKCRIPDEPVFSRYGRVMCDCENLDRRIPVKGLRCAL